MAQRRIKVILDEIIVALDGISAATKDKSIEDFRQDWLLRHGVERGIEIISEATRHLPDEALEAAPDIPWKRIRGIGNVLRHEYHKTSDAILWAVVIDSLPPLREAIEKLLALDERNERDDER